MRVLSTLICSMLAGALAGNLAALVDWRRMLLNGDFTAVVYLDRILISAVGFGALAGLVVGEMLLLMRQLLSVPWRARLDWVTGHRAVPWGLVVLLAAGTVIPRLAHPLLEGKPVLALVEQQEAESRPTATGEDETIAGRPPVILLVLDTVRADHLSLYGYHRETSPQLEALAGDATVFDQVSSSASWTIPAHATLFTGLYPHQHGVYRFIQENRTQSTPMQTYPLAVGIPTLASLLAEAGYRTATFTANPIISARSRLDRGFQLFHHSRNRNGTVNLLTEPLVLLLYGDDALAAFRQRTMTGRQVNRRVNHWLEQIGSEPFFLFINYMDAHSPYEPDPPFDRMFPGTTDDFPEWHSFTAVMKNRPRPVTGEEQQHMHALYDGAICSLDRELGLFFERLKELGLYHESLIIVTSDHGEHFGEHGLIEHSVNVYEEVLRVPLLVKYPGEPRPARVAAPANLVDILPTVLETVGLTVPDGVTGRVLGDDTRDYLLNESYDPRKVRRAGGKASRLIRLRRSIHRERMKFIWSSDQQHELYDLAADPGELANLLQDDPGLAAAWLPLAGEIEARRFIPEPPGSDGAMDEDLRRHLAELGYVE